MTDLVLPRGRPGRRGFGRYHEEYRREDGVWKIARIALPRYRIDPIPDHPEPGEPGPRPDPGWLDGLPLPGAGDLADLEAIRQLKARYFRFLDTKNWTGWRACFSDDARFDVQPGTTELTPDDFVEMLANRHTTSRTVHQGHMPEIRFLGARRARGIWALHDVVKHPASSPHVPHAGFGHYQEEYRREGGEWKIASLRLTYVSAEPDGVSGVDHDDGRAPVDTSWLGDSPLPGPDHLDDLEEIHRLKARYFRLLDSKEWDELRRVYADDAALNVIGGPIDPDTFIANRRVTLGDVLTIHQGHMPEIRFTGENTARGHWALQDYLEWSDGAERVGFVGFGHYEEDYRRDETGWKIASLRIGRLMMSRLSEAQLPSLMVR
jgi:hypothetical protein